MGSSGTYLCNLPRRRQADIKRCRGPRWSVHSGPNRKKAPAQGLFTHCTEYSAHKQAHVNCLLQLVLLLHVLEVLVFAAHPPFCYFSIANCDWSLVLTPFSTGRIEIGCDLICNCKFWKMPLHSIKAIEQRCINILLSILGI